MVSHFESIFKGTNVNQYDLKLSKTKAMIQSFFTRFEIRKKILD